MNKKTSSKTKKNVEVKENQKISTFFKKLQVKRLEIDDDDDFQTNSTKDRSEEGCTKNERNTTKKDTGERKKVKPDELKGRTKQKDKTKTDKTKERTKRTDEPNDESKPVLIERNIKTKGDENKKETETVSVVKDRKPKHITKLSTGLDVSDDDFVVERSEAGKAKPKSKCTQKRDENDKKLNKSEVKSDGAQTKSEIHPKTGLNPMKLLTDDTLEKSYLKRDQLVLDISPDPLNDITNIATSPDTSPIDRSPPHSTPIVAKQKRKHCDIPDIIPETPEDDFMIRTRPSFEKRTSKIEIEEQIVPDMIVKSPPFKIRKVSKPPELIINLSDITKTEFQEIQTKRFHQPVKETIKIDYDFSEIINKIKTIREDENQVVNNKKDPMNEISESTIPEQKLGTANESLKENNPAVPDETDPESRLVENREKTPVPDPESISNVENCLEMPKPERTVSNRVVSPQKRSSPLKPRQASPELTFNDFLNDSWDGMTADIDNLANILILDTWQYCKVLEVKTDMYLNKIIRVESEGRTVSCTLQGVWNNIKLDVNNRVNIIAKKTNEYVPYCVNNAYGFVVYEPDILISGTSVVGSLFCKRKGVLSDKFQGMEAGNEVMLIGSLIHRLFQGTLKKKLRSYQEIKELLMEILTETDTVYKIYSSDVNMDTITIQCLHYLQKIENFVKTYVTPISQPNRNWKGVIKSVEDIEENFWCTSIGIKGKIDVTIKAKTKVETILPLELKTGKASGSLEHRGQLILYTMMMNEMGYQVDSGLLLYLRDDLIVQEVTPRHNEKRDLVMLRNDLAYYLNQKPKIVFDDARIGNTKWDKSGLESVSDVRSVGNRTIASLIDAVDVQTSRFIFSELPDPIDHPTACKKCPYATICSVYLPESWELPEKHPLNEIANDVRSYLTEAHIDYFVHWTSLIQIESTYKPPLKELKDIWRLPPVEREQLGKSICFLRLAQPVVETTEPYIHHFRWDEVNKYVEGDSEKDLTRSGLTAGNYVVVSTENRVAVASGFVIDIKKDVITVGVERNLSERYGGCVFHIDTYESKTICTYNMVSIETIIEKTERSKRLRRLIVDKETPMFSMKLSKSVALAGGKILKRLNKVQQRAVLKALTAQDYLLIKGMPGTGKTATIVALIQLLVELEKTVLVTSHTNAAVDNVCLRLVDCGVDLLRLGSEHRVHPALQPYTERHKTKNCRTTEDFQRVYTHAKVLAVTCLGVHHPVLSRRTLNVCIVDESTQVLQCSVLKALKLTDSFILIGDPDQLPPVVSNPEALRRGMNESLFERLDSPASTVTLTLQYRMNKTITAVANALTYNGQLLCADDTIGYATLRLPKLERLQTIYQTEPWVITVLDPRIDRSVIGIDTGPTWKKFTTNLLDDLKVPVQNIQEDEQRACSNIYEVGITHTIIQSLLDAGVKPDTIGIIAPYRSQVSLLKKTIQKLNPNGEIEINTVDQYQGRDKDVIIYSCSRTRDPTKLKQYDFEILSDKRRLTVAITRAKHKLIVIGDFSTLKQYTPFNTLIGGLESHQVVSLEDNPEGFDWERVMNRMKN